MKIDAHHHFWQYDPAQYRWIGESMSAIRRDFLPANLKQEIDAVGIDGVVSVQARQSLDETHWLLDFAAEYDFIRGVVGWVPLGAENVRTHLDQLSDRQQLKAVRHVVHDEPDDDFILGEAFNRGVTVLADYQLTYDILIFERHLPQSIEFVDRHPQQLFVVDHLAKPRAKDQVAEPWATNLRRLAERQHVYCKLSGLVTEADWQRWSEDSIAVYLETALEAFGPRRLMFGTDWPVCLVATSYRRWYEVVERFCRQLTESEQARIFGGTAMEAYRL